MARLARAALERPPARAFGLVAANDNPTLNRTTSFTPDAWGDALNRRTSKTFASPWTADTVAYGYDLAGRPTSALYRNQAGTPGVAWTYDAAGRRTGEATNGQTLSFAYDADSNPASLTWPDAASVTFAYDPADRFGSVSNSAFSVAAGYDTLSRVNALTRPSSSSAIGYDKADRVASLAHVLSPTTGNETWTLGYTAGGQLAQATSSNSAWDWQAAPASAVATTVNGLNQNATVGAANWTYDANGNLTSDGVRTFSHDPENRLLTESGPISMTLAYDPTGRLEQSVINGTTTNFLYDGDALVAEYNASGQVLRRYVHGPEVDNPLVWFEGSAVTSANANFLIADRQGSIAGVANSSGAITANYAYDAYGAPNAWGAIGAAPRFRYTGQIAIPEAQLYYYKARVYDPVSGKFLQTDPVGDQSDLNLYAYVGGDPVNSADPSGLAGCSSSLGSACPGIMGDQAKSLDLVKQTRAALSELKSERSAIKAGSRTSLSGQSQGVESALKHAFGGASNSVIDAVNANLGKVETFLADPGSAHGGNYDYRTPTASELRGPKAASAEAFHNPSNRPNTIAVNVGIYGAAPDFDRNQTLIHEPLHVFGMTGVPWGGQDEAYRAGAISLGQSVGGTARAIRDNPDSYACFVISAGC